ncbi:hypothetical protein GALMADRAFT_132631 [Galerina marginata CBS 339.88]|uniref:Uncharacterized protein n=1 Tax=Galerina marginata (strain CBS 339.88) TaxID=685588 RepID=A0A067U175_GALM3|nr:hypothetical protein GALMADRAFT_132631 [Galerina marginata CBS 339.88]
MFKERPGSVPVVSFQRRGNNWASPPLFPFFPLQLLTDAFHLSPLCLVLSHDRLSSPGHFEQQVVTDGRVSEGKNFLNRVAKLSIAATIFLAATYGEGLVNFFALFALFVVYLMAVG